MGYGDYMMLIGRARLLRAMTKKNLTFTSKESEGSAYYQSVIKGNPYMLLSENVSKRGLTSIDLKREFLRTSDQKDARFFSPHPGEIFLDQEEKLEATEIGKQILKASDGKQVIYCAFTSKSSEVINGQRVEYKFSVNRQPSYEFVRRLIRLLSKEYFLVCSKHEDVYIGGETYILPSFSYRQLVQIMTYCDAYVGVEGGSHHAAAAAGLRGVVLYGKWLSPESTGYNFHYNLSSGYLDELTKNHAIHKEPEPSCIAALNSYQLSLILELISTVTNSKKMLSGIG